MCNVYLPNRSVDNDSNLNILIWTRVLNVSLGTSPPNKLLMVIISGTHAAINSIEKRVTCIPCSPEMFQSHAKLSTAFTQPNCDERKTPCGKGELQCGAASPSQNFKCRCDNSLGWRPNPLKGCDCFLKDTTLCVCQETACGPGEVLASSKRNLNMNWFNAALNSLSIMSCLSD